MKRGRGESKYVLALDATCMHVDVSFSYLRSAATASFDIKKFHRNCTILNPLILYSPKNPNFAKSAHNFRRRTQKQLKKLTAGKGDAHLRPFSKNIGQIL
jgi:hypothetical protein